MFEVGGVIDMQKHEIKIKEPFLTLAGQTAPSPGITVIRTGIDVLTHDVILQHIRVRTGTAGAEPRKGRAPDAFSTIGAHNVIVDHCSMTWAVDENLSASGPRFTGKTDRGMAQGHFPQHHLQQQHHRRRTTPRDARQRASTPKAR